MSVYITSFFTIRALTNMHVGSGGSNIGVVDNLVQRDPLTGIPAINASSLKGAIRNHFTEYMKYDEEGDEDSQMSSFAYRVIFGLEDKEITSIENKPDNEKNEVQKQYEKLPKQGLMKFFDAKMLFIPARSDKKIFYHTTSWEILKDFIQTLEDLGWKAPFEVGKSTENVVYGQEAAYVEDYKCVPSAETENITKIKNLFKINDLAILKYEDFKQLCTVLPVIARNNLENGRSTNLWYEEIVPRQSIFVTMMAQYNNFEAKETNRFVNKFTSFKAKVLESKIQIGGNASIGYGLTEFKVLGVSNEQ